MEGAKEDMAGEKILSIDEDDKIWSKTDVGRPRALGEALSAEPFEQCYVVTICIQYSTGRLRHCS
jgi:hypothetical protein